MRGIAFLYPDGSLGTVAPIDWRAVEDDDGVWVQVLHPGRTRLTVEHYGPPAGIAYVEDGKPCALVPMDVRINLVPGDTCEITWGPMTAEQAKAMHIAYMREGVRRGWWQDVDEASGHPIRVFKRSDFHDTALLAHAMHRLSPLKWPSVKEAKRAGGDKPLVPGTYRWGTYMMRVEG